MTTDPVDFNDAERYEDFMGPWSRSIGTEFLQWLDADAGLNWLEVGCGTGAFSELILQYCAPDNLVGIDPSDEQVEYAISRFSEPNATFEVADAEALPFDDQSFDLVASALVLNFLGDRLCGIGEMLRTVRPGGTVAGYVWDFPSGAHVSWPLERGLLSLGLETPPIPGKDDSSVERLAALFGAAGFTDIEGKRIGATRRFESFEDYWRSQVPPFSPFGRYIVEMSEGERERVSKAVGQVLPTDVSGAISYEVFASAIRAKAPG